MNYLEIKDRVIDNLGLSTAEADTYQTINNDIVDTIKAIYNLAEAPIKHRAFEVSKTSTKSIIEDFADTSYAFDYLSYEGFTLGNGKLNAVTDGNTKNILTVDKLKQIDKISFTLDAAVTQAPISPIEITVTVKDSSGSFIYSYSESISISGLTTKTYTVGTDSYHSKLTVQIVAGTYYSTLSFDNFTITNEVDNESLTLPTDFFVPKETKFLSSQFAFVGEEITPEEFMNWSPRVSITDDVSVATTEDNLLGQTSSTEENRYYDGKIGFYYSIEEDGSTILHYKPAIEGTIKTTYSIIPTSSSSNSSTIQLNEMFIDLLVYGTTVRGLRKLLLRPNDESRYIAIRSLIAEYKKEYELLLKRFIKWATQESDTHIVRANGLMSDMSMELY